MAETKPVDQIKSLLKGTIKSFSTYDANDRLENHYQAPSNLPVNGPCLRTEYTYDGTSNRVEKMRESEAPWLASYEIP